MDKIRKKVLNKTVPKLEERNRVLKIAEKIKNTVIAEVKEAGLEAEVRIGGSVAKDTWLSGEADIDLFMLVPPSLSRENLEGICLSIAKKATKGWKQRERFADHPYLEAFVNGIRINIVPS